MRTSDFDYPLPPELIAQTPVEPRDSSRLMVLDRATGTTEHRRFTDVLEYLRPGDLMVFNQSRVIPARLFGKRDDNGGRVEIPATATRGRGSLGGPGPPGRRLRPGATVTVDSARRETFSPTILTLPLRRERDFWGRGCAADSRNTGVPAQRNQGRPTFVGRPP